MEGIATVPLGLPWIRGKARLEQGEIRIDAKHAAEYVLQPGDFPGLLDALTNIEKSRDAVQFVERYGLLRAGPTAPRLAEPFLEWQERACELRAIFYLREALRRSLADPKDDRELRDRVIRIARELEPAEREGARLENVQRWADLALARAVNEGLGEARFIVAPSSLLSLENGSPVSPGHFLLSAEVHDLVEAAYCSLALAIANRKEIRSCEECERIFTPADNRQRFCTPRCATRARVRRYNETHGKQGKRKNGENHGIATS
jgi:hypothetical protein